MTHFTEPLMLITKFINTNFRLVKSIMKEKITWAACWILRHQNIPARSHPKASYTALLPKRIHPTHMATISVNMRRRYIWARRRLL